MNTIMKKRAISRVGVSLVALALCFQVGSLSEDNYVSAVEGKIEGPAAEIVDDMTFGWNLGNTFDSHGEWIGKYGDGTPSSYETAWGNPITTREMIQLAKATGVNTVRVPVTWSEHLDENNNIDEAWMNRVQEIIDYVIDEDMYCLINVHHDTGEGGWMHASAEKVDENSLKLKKIWEQICERFKDYDNKLIFEGFNEILDDNNNWGSSSDASLAAVNTLNQVFVDTVRASGGNNPTRVLSVNTYAASASENFMSKFVLPKDTVEDSLMVQVHAYTPFKYAILGDGPLDWKENGGQGQVDGVFKNIDKYFLSKDIPVIIGEFGANNRGNLDNVLEWLEYYMSSAEEIGVKCIWWDQGGKHEDSNSTGMNIVDRYDMDYPNPEVFDVMRSTTNTPLPGEEEFALGDINGDGDINTIDMFMLKSGILSGFTSDSMEMRADVNDDGKVSLLDVVVLENTILGKN